MTAEHLAVKLQDLANDFPGHKREYAKREAKCCVGRAIRTCDPHSAARRLDLSRAL